jgi:hypothetical protein
MTALARPLKTVSCLHDMRKDWCRWSMAERCGALTILLALLALFVTILIAPPSI